MGSYEIVFRKSVAKDLRALPKRDVRRILNRIRALADEPRPAGCEKLSGRELYRIRQGVYRIVYSIEDTQLVIVIIRVGHRRDVYRDR
jgi:mRNA interferase RelE/StbE